MSALTQVIEELNDISWIFIGLILVVFVCGLVLTKRRGGGRAEAATPSILTSIGILGTFVGILMGLWEFDYNQIDESLPGLLEGLKISFVTSVAGLSCSLVFRVFAPLLSTRQTQSDAQRPAEELLAEQLDLQREARQSLAEQLDLQREAKQSLAEQLDLQREAKQSLTEQLDLQREATDASNRVAQGLESVRTAISGDGDSAVATQLMKVRETIRDESKAQREDFQAFAKQVSEIGSKQLIQALEEVIRDFNSRLTEQFGDNFRRLDESVGKLLQWQDQHRQHMIDLQEAFQVARDGIVDTRDRLAEIRQEAEAIPGLLSTMKSHFERLDQQLGGLESHLVALVEMRDRAITAMPELKARIGEIFDSVQAGTSEANNRFTQLVGRTEQEFDTFIDAAGKLQKRFTETVEGEVVKIGAELGRTSQSLSEGQQKLIEGLDASREASTQRFTASMQKLEESGAKSAEQISSAAERLATSLNEEMTKVTEELRGTSEFLSSGQKTLLEQFAQSQRETIEEFAKSQRSTTEGFAQSLAKIGESTTQTVEQIGKTSQELGRSLDSHAAAQAEHLRTLGRSMQEELLGSTRKREEVLNDSIGKLDDAMREEVQRLVTAMGQHLAGVTEKFASDYAALTERMQRVVREAEKF